VAAGELVVLLGPSGCGKTTLLKTVNRLVEPSAGRVLLGGQDLQSLAVTDLRRRIGYAIQATGLFPHMTVAANIAVVPRLLGWSAARIETRVGELLALVKLPDETRQRYPRQLSGGEAQRVGLARALAADPAYLLMDEPFGAIDAINRDHLQGVLQGIQQQLRKTVLFVTHDVDEALRLADRIAVLRDGRLVQYDRPLDLLLAPADPFVADLVDAEDLFRQLSLLPVRAVMGPVAPGTALPDRGDRLSPESDLRSALMALLRAGVVTLPVVDGQDQLVGQLALSDVQRLVRAADRPPP
jgi:osmoprotectant transport system ATP-binding protein